MDTVTGGQKQISDAVRAEDRPRDLCDAVRRAIKTHGSLDPAKIYPDVRQFFPAASMGEIRECAIRVKNEPDIKVQRLRLTSAEHYKLNLWVDNNRDLIRNNAWTVADVFREVTASLKFRMSESHVRDACQLFGVILKQNASRRTRKLADRLAALEAQVTGIADRLDGLIKKLGG